MSDSQKLQNSLIRLSSVSDEIKDLQRQKSELQETVMDIIKTHNYQKKKFAVNNHMIRYKVNKVNDGLSLKFIKRCMAEYFINDPDTAQDFLKFMLSKRNSQVKESIEIKNR